MESYRKIVCKVTDKKIKNHYRKIQGQKKNHSKRKIAEQTKP